MKIVFLLEAYGDYRNGSEVWPLFCKWLVMVLSFFGFWRIPD